MKSPAPPIWLLVTADVGLFLAAWLGVAPYLWNARGPDIDFFLGTLLLPAFVVAWWARGWQYKISVGQARVLASVAQGAAWGVFFAAVLLIAAVVFSSRPFSLGILVEFGTEIARILVYTALAGAVSTLVLHAFNSGVVLVCSLVPSAQAESGEP